MGKYSSDSDSERSSRKRRKSRSLSSSGSNYSSHRKHRRSSRKKSSRKSRSSSRSRSYRSYSHSHRHRRSHSRSSYSSSRSKDYSSRRHKNKHRSRRSSSVESDKSMKSKRREKKRDTNGKDKRSPNVETQVSLPTIDLTESDKLERERMIEEIEGQNFVQKSFHSSKSEAKTKNAKEEASQFNFGTQAELNVKDGQTLSVSNDGLFSPHLFGSTEEREEKYLRKIFALRLKALNGEIIY